MHKAQLPDDQGDAGVTSVSAHGLHCLRPESTWRWVPASQGSFEAGRPGLPCKAAPAASTAGRATGAGGGVPEPAAAGLEAFKQREAIGGG